MDGTIDYSLEVAPVYVVAQEKTQLCYYKSDRDRSLGIQPLGIIPVADIRGVSLPIKESHDGKRFDLETSTRLLYLLARTSEDCQLWCSLLSLLCRAQPVRVTEDAIDRELEGDAIDTIDVEREHLKEMEQWSLSVSMDITGCNADKIAPIVVLFCPLQRTVSASSDAASPQQLAALESLLHNPAHQAGLLTFCSSMYVQEYVEFYWTHARYQSAVRSGKPNVATLGRTLYDTYVRAGAEHEIHTKIGVRDSIQQRITNHDWSYDLFHDVHKVVLAMLRVDILPKYMSSMDIKLESRRYTSGTGVCVPHLSADKGGWEEVCRTEVLVRTSKKVLFTNTTWREYQRRNPPNTGTTSTRASECHSHMNDSQLGSGTGSLIPPSLVPSQRQASGGMIDEGVFHALPTSPTDLSSDTTTLPSTSPITSIHETKEFTVCLNFNTELGQTAHLDGRVAALNPPHKQPSNGMEQQQSPQTKSRVAVIPPVVGTASSSSSSSSSTVTPSVSISVTSHDSLTDSSTSHRITPERALSTILTQSDKRAALRHSPHLTGLNPVQEDSSVMNHDEYESNGNGLSQSAAPPSIRLSTGDIPMMNSNIDATDSAATSSSSSSAQHRRNATAGGVLEGTDLMLRFHVYHVADAGDEQLANALLLGGCQVTLRELLRARNGEVRRTLTFVESQTECLRGNLNIMFHDRRRIRISSCARHVYRSYIFRDSLIQDVLCHEALHESPWTWRVPALLIRRACLDLRRERKAVLAEIADIDTAVQGCKYDVDEEGRQQQLSSFLQKRVRAYTEVLMQWEKMARLYTDYGGSYQGLRFRPSVEKGNSILSFIPINLHLQTFSVVHTGRSRSTRILPPPVPIQSPQWNTATSMTQVVGAMASSVANTMAATITTPFMQYLNANRPVSTPMSTPVSSPMPPPVLSPVPRPISNMPVSPSATSTASSSSSSSSSSAGTSTVASTSSPFSTLSNEGLDALVNGLDASQIRARGESDLSISPLVNYSTMQNFLDELRGAQQARGIHIPAEQWNNIDVLRQQLNEERNRRTEAGTLSGNSSSSSTKLATLDKESTSNSTISTNKIDTADSSKDNAALAAEDSKLSRPILHKQPPIHYNGYHCRSYVTTTVGAFAGHPHGFKHGGMGKLLSTLSAQQSKLASDIGAPLTGFEQINPTADLPISIVSKVWTNQQRQATIISQALTAMSTTFVSELLLHLHDSNRWRRLQSVGFLCQLESLLSTFSTEAFMLSDFWYAIKVLERVKFRLVELPSSSASSSSSATTISNTHTSIQSHVASPTRSPVPSDPALLSTYSTSNSARSTSANSDSYTAWSPHTSTSSPISSHIPPPPPPSCASSSVSSVSCTRDSIDVAHLPAPPPPPPESPQRHPTTRHDSTKSWMSSSSLSDLSIKSPRAHYIPSSPASHLSASSLPDFSLVQLDLEIAPNTPLLRLHPYPSQTTSIGVPSPSTRPNASSTLPTHMTTQLVDRLMRGRAGATDRDPDGLDLTVLVGMPSSLYASLPSCMKPARARSNTGDGIPSNTITITTQSTTAFLPSSPSISPSSSSSPAHSPTHAPIISPSSPSSSSVTSPDSIDSFPSALPASHFLSPTTVRQSLLQDDLRQSSSPPPGSGSSSSTSTTPSIPVIALVPILFTQGVNELQTVANKVGKTEMQTEINMYSLVRLRTYVESVHSWLKRDSESDPERAISSITPSILDSIYTDMSTMETMIMTINNEKNIQLLCMARDVVRRLEGGRSISCKSAKDRTSMSVTFEQAKILVEEHGIPERDMQNALNVMRAAGVRRLNVYKNTGQSAYAFNVLQRSLLPAVFRPPEQACSSSAEG